MTNASHFLKASSLQPFFAWDNEIFLVREILPFYSKDRMGEAGNASNRNLLRQVNIIVIINSSLTLNRSFFWIYLSIEMRSNGWFVLSNGRLKRVQWMKVSRVTVCTSRHRPTLSWFSDSYRFFTPMRSSLQQFLSKWWFHKSRSHSRHVPSIHQRILPIRSADKRGREEGEFARCDVAIWFITQSEWDCLLFEKILVQLQRKMTSTQLNSALLGISDNLVLYFE